MGEDIWTLLSTLLAVVAVLALAYWFTKNVVGRGAFGGIVPAGNGKNLQVLDRLSLGRDQQLLVVRACGHYYLLGVTQSGVTNLAELTEDEIEIWKQEPGETTTFKQAFLATLNRKK